MTTEHIPNEALEAARDAAFWRYLEDAGVTLTARDLTNGITDAVIAALPARVAPSVEDQRQMTARVRAVLALARSRETWDGIDIERLASDCAYAAYSWPSSQPTVAEVREKVAREIESNSIQHMPWLRPHEVIAVLARVARGETKEADHGE